MENETDLDKARMLGKLYLAFGKPVPDEETMFMIIDCALSKFTVEQIDQAVRYYIAREDRMPAIAELVEGIEGEAYYLHDSTKSRTVKLTNDQRRAYYERMDRDELCMTEEEYEGYKHEMEQLYGEPYTAPGVD